MERKLESPATIQDNVEALCDHSDDETPIDLTTEEPSSEYHGADDRTRKQMNTKTNPDQSCTFAKEEAKRRSANVQERHRMQRMSGALQQLKDCLPDEFKLYNKKLSKIRTLRVAINYIRALDNMLKSTPTPVKQEQLPVCTPGPNVAYLTALGTCTPQSGHVNDTSDVTETRYPIPTPYSAYFPASPYWITGGLHTPVSRLGHLPKCYDTPIYPTPTHYTPDTTPGTATSMYGVYHADRSDCGPHRLSGVAKRLVRSSVYASPFGFGRNVNELDTSFLSAASEDGDVDGPDRFSNDCSFGMEGIYPLPTDNATPDRRMGHLGYRLGGH